MFRRRGVSQAWSCFTSLLSKQASSGASPYHLPSFQGTRQAWSDARGYQRFGDQGFGYANRFASKRTLYVCGAVGTGGAIYYYQSLEEIPYTHRWHAIFISPEYEKKLGKQTFTQLKEKALRDGTLLPSQHPAAASVTRVGSRIADKADDTFGGGFTSHMQGLEWEFIVIKEPIPNAFVLPGGKVVVYTGLLRLLSNDDELAGVLAHEVAHVVARHAGERISRALTFQVLQLLLYYFTGIPFPEEAVQLALMLPNSRRQETEADMIGMKLAARSCFDPAGSASVFRKLGAEERRMGGGRVPAFLSTHPLSAKRVQEIEENLPQALALFELSGCYDRKATVQELFALHGFPREH